MTSEQIEIDKAKASSLGTSEGLQVKLPLKVALFPSIYGTHYNYHGSPSASSVYSARALLMISCEKRLPLALFCFPSMNIHDQKPGVKRLGD